MNADPAHDLDAPDPRLRTCVIIPARDEVDHLAATLTSLAQQRDWRGEPLNPATWEVILLANNCGDETAEVARQFLGDHASALVVHIVERIFPGPAAHVGTARKWLMDRACERLEAIGQPRGLILSTDADTQVDSRWLVANQAEVDAGADAIAGRIEVDRGELKRLGRTVRRGYWLDRVYRRLKLELEARLDPNPLDPWPRHDFHGGASFGVTPAIYRQVGGLVPLPSQEDVALAEALWRIDARFVHSNRVRVTTSARLLGRAQGGLSESLAGWAADESRMVADSDSVQTELLVRRSLRWCFEAKARPGYSFGTYTPTSLATTLGLDVKDLIDLMLMLNHFGQWLEAIQALQASRPVPVQPRQIPIQQAIGELRSLIRSLPRNRRSD